MPSSRSARTGSRVPRMTSPTGSDPRRHGSQAGFTLLELLVVTLILMVLVGVSVPQFRRTFRHLQLQVFASDVAKLLTYANRRAVSNFATSEAKTWSRSEEHTSELQSRPHLVCRLLLEK